MARQRGYDQQANRGTAERDVDRDTRRQLLRHGGNDSYGEAAGARERQAQRYGQDFYDEFPDGGRGVYTHEQRPFRLSTKPIERDHEFVEAVYGPQHESYMPHKQDDFYSGRRAGYSDIERNNYGASYNEHLSGYGSSTVVGSNWNRTAGAGDWAADAGSRSHEHATSYRGKGPKGYERSDELLQELVCERLTEAASLDASDITVEVKNHEVTLSGTVTSRAAKHLAEDLIESVWGISEINNHLKLRAGEQRC